MSETMRIGTHTKIWCVTEPTPTCELIDICFQTSIKGLLLQARGGLTAAEHKPAIFAGPDAENEAKQEAARRLNQLADRMRKIAAEAIGPQIPTCEWCGCEIEPGQAKLHPATDEPMHSACLAAALQEFKEIHDQDIRDAAEARS